MTFLQTSTSAIPYLFPPSNCYLSFTPSLDFPPSLREFLHTCLNRDLDRCEAKDKRERKQIKISSLGTDTPSGASLSRLRIFFFFFTPPPFPAGLFCRVVWSLWLFQTVGVAVVWDGCHHAAGKTGGAAAVPTSENSQAEGKTRLDSGGARDKTSGKPLRREESGSRGYCWWLLLGFCRDGLTPLRVFILFYS